MAEESAYAAQRLAGIVYLVAGLRLGKLAFLSPRFYLEWISGEKNPVTRNVEK